MGGSEPSDFLWTTSVDAKAVHQRVIDLLDSLGATGWTTYPVTVSNKRGEILDGYQGLSITGRCGPRDLGRSVIDLFQLPGGWFPRFRGFFFDEESWDGSDLFMAELHRTMLLTERVATALDTATIQNVRLTRLSETETATLVYEIGAPAADLPPDFRERVHRAYDAAGVPRPRRWAARLID